MDYETVKGSLIDQQNRLYSLVTDDWRCYSKAEFSTDDVIYLIPDDEGEFIIACAPKKRLACITDFYEMDDFYEGSDYNRVLHDGYLISQFELVD